MIIEQASSLPADQRYCVVCEKPLKGKFAWCEKDCHVYNGYHAEAGQVAPERSQGWFPLGLTCAKKFK